MQKGVYCIVPHWIHIPVKEKLKTDKGFSTTLHAIRILMAQGVTVKAEIQGKMVEIKSVKRSGTEKDPTFEVEFD